MRYTPLLLLLILLLPGLAFSPSSSPIAGSADSPSLQSDEIAMQVEAGVDGWYRAGQWVPLQVLVESQNTTIDGKLQVRVNRSSTGTTQFETTYETPFTITGGGSKRVFLYVSLEDFTREIQVELVNNRGEVITSQRTEVQQLDHSDLLYVVVTESTSGVLDVTRYPVGRGDNFQTGWRISDIPPNPDALRAIDIMIFSDVDTGQLGSDQQQAIADWVAAGGHLIVTGGSNWQRTTVGLLDLLPVTPEETVTLDNLVALGKFLRQPEDVLDAETLVSDSTPLENATVLLNIGDTPILVRRSYGGGTVDFVAVDATIEPLRSWSEVAYLWQELVYSAGSRPSWSNGVERFDLARDAVSNVTGFDLPAVLQLGAFLILYIALMGPLNYLILNAIGRREFAWFTIPVLILAFTGFAYFTGFSVRGDDVTVNQISVVQTWDDVERARVDGVIGILSPRRTTYDVMMDNQLTLRSIPNVTESLGVSQITIDEGENYVAEDIPVDAAIMTSFATSGYIDAPTFTGHAEWTLVGEQISSRIEGEVTNGLPVELEDAVILADDMFYQIGDLDVGESATFQLIMPLESPRRLTTGSLVDPTHPVLYPGYRRSPYDICYMSNGLNVVYENVMSGQDFQCSGGGDDDAIRLRRRGLLLAAINNEIDRNGGRGNKVYLLGWSEEPPLNIDIPNTGQASDGTVLYIYEIPTEIRYSNPSRVTLPPGFFMWTLVEQDALNRLPEVNPDLSFQLIGEQGVAIRFMPLSELSTVDRIDLTMDWRKVGNPLKLSLWNWDAQDWEPIEFVDENQTEFIIDDPADYLGPQNAVQILIESQDSVAFQSVNTLTVAMSGSYEE